MANSCNSGDKFDDLQMFVIDNDFEPWNPFRSLLVKIIVSLNKAQGEINHITRRIIFIFRHGFYILERFVGSCSAGPITSKFLYYPVRRN